MKKHDFSKMLPDEKSEAFERTKAESPYSILNEYATAVNSKYQGSLKCFITESSKLKSSQITNLEVTEIFSIALSFEAAIGRGYLYRLLEIEQLKSTTFPVRIKVFRDNTTILGTYDKYETFYPALINFLDSSIVKTIILNLLAQVELYKESRTQE